MSLPKPYYDSNEYGITIYNGDCREILPQLGKFDLLLTDPPYGIKMDKGVGGGGYDGFGNGTKRMPKKYEGGWDDVRPTKDTFDLLIASSAISIIWGGNYFADVLPKSTHWLVWDKLQTMPTFSDCELAWTSSVRKSVKKFTVEQNGMCGGEQARYHPTQKPIQLMMLCIQHVQDAKTVVDPFMGSGTTLRACKDLGRKCIGIELSEKYCEIAVNRLAQHVMFTD